MDNNIRQKQQVLYRKKMQKHKTSLISDSMLSNRMSEVEMMNEASIIMQKQFKDFKHENGNELKSTGIKGFSFFKNWLGQINKVSV